MEVAGGLGLVAELGDPAAARRPVAGRVLDDVADGRAEEREADPASDELAAAMQRIGELSMEVELLRAKMGRTSGPLARRRWR